MLTSPITVTIDGVAHQLSRINQDNFGSLYRKKTSTQEIDLQIRHSYEGKAGPTQIERHNVDLKTTTWDVDGKPIIRQTYVILRNPRPVDPVDTVNLAKALSAFVTANSTAIAGWES